jgi:hypothetical protein
MVTISTAQDLAHASIPVPPNLNHLGKARHDVFLRPTADGRFRWFHADGTRTVVDGASVEQALHVAQIVWQDVQVLHSTTAAQH